LAEVTTGKSYREAGLTLQRMGLAGLSAEEVKALLERGFE
jgi:hypothetical protein